MTLGKKALENTVGKGENAGNQLKYLSACEVQPITDPQCAVKTTCLVASSTMTNASAAIPR